jgi:hypothetical protein
MAKVIPGRGLFLVLSFAVVGSGASGSEGSMPSIRGAARRTLPVARRQWIADQLDTVAVIDASGQARRMTIEVSRAETAWVLRHLGAKRQARGDGGGASVENLFAMQARYRNSNCPFIPEGGAEPANVIFLFWDNPSANPLGVDVFLDGSLLTTVQDNPQNPAQTVFPIAGIEGGVHVFRVEEGNEGTSAEVEIEIFDTQPMADARDLTVEEGPTAVAEGGAESCALVASWKNLCPAPDTYAVIISGQPVDPDPNDGVTPAPIRATIDPIQSYYTLLNVGGAPDGDYSAQIVAFLEPPETPNVLYRGCFVSSGDPVAFDCDPAPCTTPPSGLTMWQFEYSPNSAVLVYVLGEAPYSGGLNVYFDGVLFDPDADGISIPTDPAQGLPDGLIIDGPAGMLRVGLQGACGPGETTAITETTFNFLAATPHTEPVNGSIVSAFDQNLASTTATWVNADCSAYSELFKVVTTDPQNPVSDFQGRVTGNDTSATIENTFVEDLMSLQFYTWVGPDDDLDLYGSIEIRSTTEVEKQYFIRGLCNAGNVPAGSIRPQLTDGIFVLNFLFQGGAEPACHEACDANGDHSLVLSDAVYIFQFLFLGGPAPAGWSENDPACTEIVEGMDCATPNPDCPLQ